MWKLWHSNQVNCSKMIFIWPRTLSQRNTLIDCNLKFHFIDTTVVNYLGTFFIIMHVWCIEETLTKINWNTLINNQPKWKFIHQHFKALLDITLEIHVLCSQENGVTSEEIPGYSTLSLNIRHGDSREKQSTSLTDWRQKARDACTKILL